MYVAFAGMTVHPENNWPLDRIDPVVQQTLDAIEYAIGPIDRAAAPMSPSIGAAVRLPPRLSFDD